MMMTRRTILLLVLSILTSRSTAVDAEGQADQSPNDQIENTIGEQDSPSDSSGPLVQTTGGPVLGTTSDDGLTDIFYSIPYGTAPRFGLSKFPTPWQEPLKAQRPGPFCYQHLKSLHKRLDMIKAMIPRPWSDDCLTLSVWAPRPRTTGAPVLVFIHGGAFVIGSSLMFVNGSNLATKDVVVVSPNYRLGAFGFFNLGIPEAPGNQGLMDQNLALQWVRDNAEAFGGDPKLVTIMGVSGGAASVGFQLLSPTSRGLFRNAVMMGGAPTNPWAIKEPEDALKSSRDLAKSLGCEGPNALDCLRNRDPEDVLDIVGAPEMLPFIPTVDGHFLTEHPSVSIAAGRVSSSVPVLAGWTEKEGAQLLGFRMEVINTPDGRTTRDQFLTMIRNLDRKFSDLQVHALDVLYSDGSEDPFRLRDAAVRMYGDNLIICGMNELADSVAKSGALVYKYVFGFPGGEEIIRTGSWGKPSHGADYLPVLAPRVLLGSSPRDLKVSDKFQQHFLNFVRNGDPNLSKKDYPDEPLWPAYDLSHKRHLYFNERSRVESGFSSRECRAWSELLPLLAKERKC